MRWNCGRSTTASRTRRLPDTTHYRRSTISTTTTSLPIDTLRRIVAAAADEVPHAEIAQSLNADGITVPRDGADHPTLFAREDGYNLPTAPANPSAWTAAVVAAVLAAPEADPADNYAVAQSRLDSDVLTVLTLD